MTSPNDEYGSDATLGKDSTSASPSTPNPRMAAARMDFALRAEDRRAGEDAYNRFLIYFVAPTFLLSMLLSAPVVMVGVWLLIPVLAAAALLSLATWLKVAADSNARKWRKHWRRDSDEEDPPANSNMARVVVNGDGARPMDKGKGKMPMVNGNGSHERIY